MISDLTGFGVRAMGPSRGPSVRGGGAPGLLLGLTSYWKMYEAPGVTRVDSIGTSNLVDVNANVGQSSTTILGGFEAIFAPTSSTKALQAGSTPYLGNASFTISGWIAYAPNDVTPLISKWSVGNEYILFDSGSGVLIWEAKEAGTLTTRSITFTPGAGTKYYTIGYDDTNKVLFAYLNGVSQGTAACNGINTTTEPLTFGNYGGVSVGDQSGFQDFGFWRRVLTAAEVAQLYGGGAGKAFSTF